MENVTTKTHKLPGPLLRPCSYTSGTGTAYPYEAHKLPHPSRRHPGFSSGRVA